ncbi:YybH family protein [Alsobacter sp. SYSU BS001988]
MKVSRTIVMCGGLVAASALHAQDKAVIDKHNLAFETAFNTGDFETVASMYAEDAFLLPAGSPLVQGRSKIKAFWSEAAKAVGDLTLTADDVKPLGPAAAREIGRFSLKSKGQNAQEMSGKYVVLWEKVGADWKLSTDIWNADR